MNLTTFQDLGLSVSTVKALTEQGYSVPTPIQAQAIPIVLKGTDLLGIAQTGTGKTAAFALPILERLALDPKPAQRKGCRVLVLSPTRELASQIAGSFRTYGRHQKLTVAVVYGGVGHRPQKDAMMRGVDVLVATPGRLLDHMDERNIMLEGTEIFVLDEADQMLDLGFVKPIRRILSKLAARRQSLFFSATMPTEIGALAAELLTKPVKVSVTPTATTVDRVEQRVIHIEKGKKRALLAELLSDPKMSRALVFTRTKRGADRVAKHLNDAGMEVAAIHGNKSQRQREEALASFKDATIRVLVATDIAARGIDIDRVTHVVNFEMPDVPESYVHRIGRTARAGEGGIAISLVDGEERTQLRDIERLTRQTIKAEDRRGDAKLEADKVGSQGTQGRERGERRDMSNRRHGDHRGDHKGEHRGSGKSRQPGRGANPGARHARRPDDAAREGQPASQGYRAHPEGERPAHTDTRGDARGQSGAQGYRAKPVSHQGEREDRGQRPAARPERREGSAPQGGRERQGSLSNVQFLARPARTADRPLQRNPRNNANRSGRSQP